jgi:hypothetical protein
MKKTIPILLVLVWFAALVVLIIALINQNSDNPFVDYRYIIGIGFIALTGFIRIAYKRLNIRK